MAACDACGQQMTTAAACWQRYETDGTPRLAYGRESFMSTGAAYGPCVDCGVTAGALHHPGCDLEECARCHRQRLGCTCYRDDSRDGGGV